jgi:hypothetical protein
LFPQTVGVDTNDSADKDVFVYSKLVLFNKANIEASDSRQNVTSTSLAEGQRGRKK